MSRVRIKALYGNEISIDMKDLHGKPVDGIDLIHKILPSSTREEIINMALDNDKSEVLTIVQILCKYFDNKEKQ